MLTEIKMNCFIAVAETLNFSNAGKMLYLSQQAVSRNIAILEEELGYPLLNREPSISLTPEGKQTYDLFLQVLRMTKSEIRRIRSGYELSRNTVTIGIQNSFNLSLPITQALHEVNQDSDLLKIDVLRFSPSLLLNRLMTGELDMVIMNERFVKDLSSLHMLELGISSMVIMLSANHPCIVNHAPIEEIRKLPCLIDQFENESDEDFHRRAENDMRLCGLTPSAVITLPNRDSVYTAAEMERGVAIGTSLGHLTIGNQLKSIITEGKDPVVALWTNDSKLDIVQPFVNALAKEMNILLADGS